MNSLCIIPFIDTKSERVSNEEVVFPFMWEQKRMLLTGKYREGHHIVSYGLIQNHGDYSLETIRFLCPGHIAYIKDLSTEAWTPGEGPDRHWKIRNLRKLSSKTRTISVWHPYPQGYIFLKGQRRACCYMGTVEKHKVVAKHPPYPLSSKDVRFRKILTNPKLSFMSNKAVQTEDKKLLVKLAPLVQTEIIMEVNLEPGESRFFAFEFFVPKIAVKHTPHLSQWNSYGPTHFLSSVGSEVDKLGTFEKELDARSDSVDRFQQFFSRVKHGMCDLVEFWATLAFEEQYKSSENIMPLDVYHSRWTGGAGTPYQSKTWIFDNLNFYIVSVITPR